MLVEIKATFKCDLCGIKFIVGVEPAGNIPAGWSVFECAEDDIRGGRDYQDERNEPGAVGSVDRHRHLCARCTRKMDSKPPSERRARP